MADAAETVSPTPAASAKSPAPELLAPVGDWDAMCAAVANGP